MAKTINVSFIDEASITQWAVGFAALLTAPLRLYFSGELGAGKTTMIRAILRGLGVEERIKSPSFAIVEPYEVGDLPIYHLDLYRIQDPDALEYIGIREYFTANALCFIEWPEQGGDLLPVADLSFLLTITEFGRDCHITANTPLGETVLEKMS